MREKVVAGLGGVLHFSHQLFIKLPLLLRRRSLIAAHQDIAGLQDGRLTRPVGIVHNVLGEGNGFCFFSLPLKGHGLSFLVVQQCHFSFSSLIC